MQDQTNQGSRVLISMPEAFLQRVDTFAKQESRSRSELIREALRHYMRFSDSSKLKATENAQKLEELL